MALLSRRRAFTLLELIVVIVILAILAALAIPSFAKVTKTSKLKTAETTLAAASRDAVALASFEGQSWTVARVAPEAQTAVEELSTSAAGAPGLLAATSWTAVFPVGTPGVKSQGAFSGLDGRTVSVLVSTTGIDMALYVPGAGCAFSAALPGGSVATHHVIDAPATSCGASNAGSVLSDDAELPSLGTPPTPQWVKRGTANELIIEVPGPEAYDVYIDGKFVGTTDASGRFTGPAGSYVDPSRVTLVKTTPTASTGLITSTGATTITWSAAAVPAGATVRVYRDGVLIATLPVGSTSFIDPNPANGVRYAVKPVTATGELAPIAVTTAPTPAPPVVMVNNSGEACTNFGSVEYRDGAFRVSWQSVSATPTVPLSGYKLYRLAKGATAAQWTSAQPVYTGTATSFVDPQTTGSWAFRVSAYGVGGESAKSPVQCVDTIPAPPVPTLTAKAGDSSVVLTWNAVAGATSYEVFRIENGTPVPVTSVTTTTTTVTPLTNGVTHSFVIKAKNVGNTSAASNTASAMPLAPIPAVPSLSASMDRATGKVTLTWPAVARADSYSLYRDGVLLRSGVTALSYIDTLTEAQGTVAYTLAAVSTGGESAKSNAVRVGVRTYSDLVTSDAPVGYFRLNEAAGADAVNSASASVPGRLGNASYVGNLARAQSSPVTADSTSKALGFNGGYVNLPAMTLSEPKGYTIELWYAATSASNWQRILELSNNGSVNGEFFVPVRTSDGGVCACGTGARYVGTTAPASNGAWHHLVITEAPDGTTKMYLDGVVVSSAQYGASTAVRSFNVNYLGKSISPDPIFFGSMSEVAIYDKALTATQVSQHYSAR